MRRLSFLFLLFIVTALTACQTNYTELPTYSGARQLQVVIEVPAGDAYATVYNKASHTFEKAKVAGKDLIVNSLPYPGNYGFIPSTEIGAAGRGLSALVIADRAESGTVTEVIPLATLMLEKPTGDLYPVIICTPARPSEQLIKAWDFVSFSVEYPAVKNMLQQWFVSRSKTEQLTFVGWKDEKFAEKEIQRWMKL
ncbi:inorganic diphosphatase [Pontibacter sp. Tf4]|uniref:inorganic diphosphatase n=1 Tax=Pontibacter sp. Tf4 TaxID=2761620 RepID=UPI00162713FC|nr:inorganic diphosphatase [Pontibacter sp. Tf4]MBB6612311.1 inorganic diphosphatase [Pontibacter sp. Tf4]